MATNTFIALDKVTVGTAVSSITFSSINQGYTDLVVVCYARSTGAFTADDIIGQFNSDTTSNYSNTQLFGNGSTASSNRQSSQTSFKAGLTTGTSSASNVFATSTLNIMNYANTTTFKTAIVRKDNAESLTMANVSLWRKTPEAITSLLLAPVSGNFAVGSTFSLYGIASEEAVAKATGGIVTSDANYFYHTFLASGTFTPKQSLTADVLVVGGGGGGGRTGGGGGGGGLLTFASQSLTATGYTTTVGGGGAGNNVDGQQGGYGGDSQFGALTLVKGGGGGGSYGSNGNAGGSGGGGGSNDGGPAKTGGAATSGQGNAGGNGYVASGSTTRANGGGGGAGAAGATATISTGGNGGVGLSNSYSGTATFYAGGGGGSASGTGGLGGNGGGGNGSGTAQSSTDGTANTGGGGGGQSDTTGKNGGSGIVIVRYPRV